MMRGCDTCAQDLDGYTAAHYAAERDDVEMLKALTTHFHSSVNPLPLAQLTMIHEQCLKALTIKNKQGLTVFMLACYRESLKCLNYLIELNINDCSQQVVYYCYQVDVFIIFAHVSLWLFFRMHSVIRVYIML
jgi:ankyrin repeat protein